MKLFTKICLIAAVVAGGLGIIGIVIGMSMGARMEDLDNLGIDGISIHTNPRFSVQVEDNNDTAASHYNEHNIGDIVETRNNKHNSNDIAESHGTNDHNIIVYSDMDTSQTDWKFIENYDCTNIRELELEVDQGVVNIYVSSLDNTITCYADTNNIKCEIDEGKLSIEYVEPRLWRGFVKNRSWSALEMELYIPEDILREMDMELGACSVYAERLNADNIFIELGAGQVIVDEMWADTKAQLQVGTGQMTVESFEGNSLDLDCGIGSMVVICNGNKSDYNYSLECGIGNIQLDDTSYSGIGQGMNINNNAQRNIDVECGIGEVALEFPNRQ